MKISINSAFGSFCEYLRHKKGLSQKTLSEDLGINIGTVSRVERGFIDADLKRLHQMANYFQCTPGYIMTNTWDQINTNIHFVEMEMDSELDQFVDFMKFVELKLNIPRNELMERFFTEDDNLIRELSKTYVHGTSLPEMVAEVQLRKELDKQAKKSNTSKCNNSKSSISSNSILDFGD